MVRCIDNSVFYRKNIKLIISLIRMPKSKTTLIMKQESHETKGVVNIAWYQ